MERHELENKRQAKRLEQARRAYNIVHYVNLALNQTAGLPMDEWTYHTRKGLFTALVNTKELLNSLDPNQEAQASVDVDVEPFMLALESDLRRE